MALVAIASAKGAPGVTTAALALAALWPRPVLLADCDTAGGDVALRMPTPAGPPPDPEVGLVSMAAAARHGLSAGSLTPHLQQVVGGLDVLVGLRSPEQGVGLDPLWPALGGLLANLEGTDVVADLGRVGPGAPTLPLLRSAHLVVLVCRPSVASVFHTRERLAALTTTLRSSSVDAVRTAVLVVADAQQAGDVRAVHEALARQEHAPDHVWQLSHDAKGAAIFDGAVVSRPERTLLVRSASVVAAAAAAVVAPFTRPAPVVAGLDVAAAPTEIPAEVRAETRATTPAEPRERTSSGPLEVAS